MKGLRSLPDEDANSLQKKLLTNILPLCIIYIDTLCIETLCIGGILMDIKKELTKGSSAMLVLSVLEKEDLYGYMIIKRIAQKSEDVFSFKEGTLYPILHNFESNGYVKSYTVEVESRKRKYYKITKKGIKALNEARKEWEAYTMAVRKVIDVNPVAALV